MKTKTLSFKDDQVDIDLVITEATAVTSMKRAILAGRAQAYVEQMETRIAEEGADAVGGLVTAEAQSLLARILYPDLLAAVTEASGLDPDLPVADFMSLPQKLTDAWQNLVYELNPHWYSFRRQADESEEEQKKDEDENDENSSDKSASS